MGKNIRLTWNVWTGSWKIKVSHQNIYISPMAPSIPSESYWFTETAAEVFAEDHSKYPNKHLNTYQCITVNPHLAMWQTKSYMVRSY